MNIVIPFELPFNKECTCEIVHSEYFFKQSRISETVSKLMEIVLDKNCVLSCSPLQFRLEKYFSKNCRCSIDPKIKFDDPNIDSRS